MNRLDKIKNEVAREYGYSDFYNSTYCGTKGQLNIFDEVTKRYAREVAIASLKKASENAIAIYDGEFLADVNKQSITQESNIVMI